MTLEILAAQQKPNRYASLVSTVLERRKEIRKEFIRDSFCGLSQVEHKLEKVAAVQGMEFINDSKSTSVNSTWFALESFHQPVIWIAGGVDSKIDYTPLLPLVRKRVKLILCLSADNSRLHKAFRPLGIPMVDVSSMEEAVEISYLKGEKGDVVLLSPASPSFDLFANYEERGIAFRKAVKRL